MSDTIIDVEYKVIETTEEDAKKAAKKSKNLIDKAKEAEKAGHVVRAKVYKALSVIWQKISQLYMKLKSALSSIWQSIKGLFLKSEKLKEAEKKIQEQEEHLQEQLKKVKEKVKEAEEAATIETPKADEEKDRLEKERNKLRSKEEIINEQLRELRNLKKDVHSNVININDSIKAKIKHFKETRRKYKTQVEGFKERAEEVESKLKK